MVEDYNLETGERDGEVTGQPAESPPQGVEGPGLGMGGEMPDASRGAEPSLGPTGMDIPAMQMGQMDGLSSGWDYAFNPMASL